MQVKKILAIFLAAALIFSLSTVSVGAENNGIFKVGVVAETATPISSEPAIYSAGDEISVKISASQNTGVTGLNFALKFDTEALEYVDFTLNGLFVGCVESVVVDKVADGVISYRMLTYPNSYTFTGDIFTVKFIAKADFCGEVVFEIAKPENGGAANIGTKYLDFEADTDSFALHPIDATAGVVTDPTCTDKGFTTYHCAACNTDVVGNYVDALGHDIVTHDAQAPTCTEIGWDAYDTCSRCDYSTYVELSALGHRIENAPAKKPTCTEDGWTSYQECTRDGCDFVTPNAIIPALGHDLIPHDAQAPTCTETGWDAYDTCSRCDYSTYVELSALGHTAADAVVEDYIAPTCTIGGSYNSVVYCSDCGIKLSTENVTVDALGHDLISHDAQAATCTSIGWNAYDSCSRCDYTTYSEIPFAPHTLDKSAVENTIQPTCVDNGSYDIVVYCSVCDEEFLRKTEVIPASGHTYGDTTVVEPSYKQEGYSIHTCAVCGFEEKFDFVDAIEFIYGDCNNDGKINNKDVGILLQFINLWPVEINTYAADVNNDNKINNKDIGILLQYINNWNVQLG